MPRLYAVASSGETPTQRERGVHDKRLHQYLCPSWIRSPSERKAVFASEVRHIPHSLSTVLLFQSCRPLSSQRFEGTSDYFLGSVKAACAQLLLDQVLTAGIKSNGHNIHLYPRRWRDTRDQIPAWQEPAQRARDADLSHHADRAPF
jgi:hypothetical protein